MGVHVTKIGNKIEVDLSKVTNWESSVTFYKDFIESQSREQDKI